MFFEDIIFNVNDDGFDTKIDDVTEGFWKGNCFKNEYVPYKGYKVGRLDAKSEKGDLLLKIYEYDFALNDLALYLDLHPNDSKVYELFRQFTKAERKYVEMFEEKYGPLELCESDYAKYMWNKEPWPFIGGDI